MGLVCNNTIEMYYSTKRQRFLVSQGYSYKIITELVRTKEKGLLFSSSQDQNKLLRSLSYVMQKNFETYKKTAESSKNMWSNKKNATRHINTYRMFNTNRSGNNKREASDPL